MLVFVIQFKLISPLWINCRQICSNCCNNSRFLKCNLPIRLVTGLLLREHLDGCHTWCRFRSTQDQPPFSYGNHFLSLFFQFVFLSKFEKVLSVFTFISLWYRAPPYSQLNLKKETFTLSFK